MTDLSIFKACFPQVDIDEYIFNILAYPDGSKVFRSDGAFAVCCGGHITLLCVAPEYRRKGTGSELLKQCEKHISDNGFKAVTLGGSIIPGAVSGSYDFLSKRGYSIGGEFNEMTLELGGFSCSNKLPDDISFRLGSCNEQVRQAVAKVDDDWVQYFTDDQTVFCGYDGEQPVCFCIIGDNEHCLLSTKDTRTGSIGCVGTVPEYRRKGLGLTMVALGAEHLKTIGCDKVFIHMTHLDKWYAKLGAKVVLKYSMAEKVIG